MDDMPDLRVKILLKLAYEHPLTFSDLKEEDIASNRFSYHLTQLRDEGYIKKTDAGYELTDQGEQYIARLSEEGFETKQQPILGVIGVIEEGGSYLISKRKKHPFRGYEGFPHGRISMGEGIEDAAERVLDERTGLSPRGVDVEGLWITNTVRDSSTVYTHYFFVFTCDSTAGELIEETRDLTNRWVDGDDLDTIHRFKDTAYIREIAEQEGFTMMRSERYQEGDEFTGIEVLDERSF